MRDSTFRRATFDKAFLLPLGRDLEISCLQFGPEIGEIQSSEGVEELQTKGTYTEVVRLRADWPEAINLAMQILNESASRDLIDINKLIDVFSKMTRTTEKVANLENLDVG